jgi:hypothetical protein
MSDQKRALLEKITFLRDQLSAVNALPTWFEMPTFKDTTLADMGDIAYKLLIHHRRAELDALAKDMAGISITVTGTQRSRNPAIFGADVFVTADCFDNCYHYVQVKGDGMRLLQRSAIVALLRHHDMDVPEHFTR